MISTRSVGLVIDTFVCLTLAKWETVSGHFGGYLTRQLSSTCPQWSQTTMSVVGVDESVVMTQ
jgi:hypothetical protein